MRPLVLEVEGLTTFREKVVLDFGGLDLFALTGPTGSGKSSLVDALVLALYGQVPRVGREYKQLISHGATRLSVRLDFQVGGARYRIARTIRGSGASQLRLERLEGERAEPIADRLKEIEEEVERIVGLDYEAFTRSVVLPQGQFDAFLKGKPEERRKILVTLLNLHVYEVMQRIVNARATEARREAAFISQQLAADFADASPEALAERRRELELAEEQARGLEAARAALAAGVKAAQGVRAARRDADALGKDAAAEAGRLRAAEQARDRALRQCEAIEGALGGLEQRLTTVGFDEARYLALLAVKPRAEQLAALRSALARLEAEQAAARAGLDARRAALECAEQALPGLEQALERLEAAAERARAARDALRQRYTAQELRRHLRPGEACPVCEQVVRSVPRSEAPALETADAAVAAAEAAEQQAARAREAGRIEVERLRADRTGAERETERIERQRQEARETAAPLEQALGEVGFEPAPGAEAGALVAPLERELAALARARSERDRLDAERKAQEAERGRLETQLATTQAQADAARARLEELERRSSETGTALERARAELLALAGREGWADLESPVPGRDEADVIESLRSLREAEATALAASIARLRSETERLARAIARAGELAGRKAGLEAAAALYATLAQQLQANHFIAYVQEEALRVLAEDGSRHLRTLSQGRYSLTCEQQDFQVIDHWNADTARSVKTLSGGETFLASLALALALAERLAELSAEGRAGEALESLFLDEGFGTLDPEALDLVVQALEALQGGQRMVGVVTHIPDLAERLPARIEVGRSATGARLEVR